MFDLGWMELLVIGVVALIVVGPKDLPVMFKTVGNFVGKAQKMAREFRRTMDAAASDTGLKETAETLKNIDSSRNPKAFFEKAKDVFLSDNEKNLGTKMKKSSLPKKVSEDLISDQND